MAAKVKRGRRQTGVRNAGTAGSDRLRTIARVVGDGYSAAGVPVAVGLNVTEMMHFFPGNTELAQVVVSAKGTLATMLLIVSVAVPVLVKETLFAALVEPTATLPKVRDVGESVTVCRSQSW